MPTMRSRADARCAARESASTTLKRPAPAATFMPRPLSYRCLSSRRHYSSSIGNSQTMLAAICRRYAEVRYCAALYAIGRRLGIFIDITSARLLSRERRRSSSGRRVVRKVMLRRAVESGVRWRAVARRRMMRMTRTAELMRRRSDIWGKQKRYVAIWRERVEKIAERNRGKPYVQPETAPCFRPCSSSKIHAYHATYLSCANYLLFSRTHPRTITNHVVFFFFSLIREAKIQGNHADPSFRPRSLSSARHCPGERWQRFYVQRSLNGMWN